MRLRHGGLRATLVLTLAGVMAVGVVLIGFVVTRVTGQLVAQEEGRFGEAVLDVAVGQLGRDYDTSRSLTNPANQQAVTRMVEALARLPDVEEVVVVGPSMRPVASYPPSSSAPVPDPSLAAAMHRGERIRRFGVAAGGESRVYVYVPLSAGAGHAGAVRLGVRPDVLGRRVEQARNLILFYLVVNVLVLLLAGAYLLDRWMIRPVRRLTEATERLATGEPTTFVDVETEDALGRLSRAFNRMVERLARSRSEVERRIGELEGVNAELEGVNTELEAVNAELEAVNAELKEARDTVVRSEKLASVGTLAAGVAHEVGNPLAAILGYVEILQAASPPPGQDRREAADILARIHKEVLRIHEIIRELLAYSRAAPEEAYGSVAEAVDSAVALVRPQPRMRGVDIQVDVAPGLPAVALSEARLQQVLLNLCLNAADAMQAKGGGSLRVSARLCLDGADAMQAKGGGAGGVPGADREPARTRTGPVGEPGGAGDARGAGDAGRAPGATRAHGAGRAGGAGRILVAVADDGVGIPPERLARVFDPFFTTKAPGEGTGLGLAIVDRIIQDHGGQVDVQSEVGVGTTFTLVLPVYRPTPRPSDPALAAS